jgi:hypothetical protein
MSESPLGGLSVLDHFRPPEGFRTTAAIATTYSADLLACLALLTAMDGTSGDTLDYGKIPALRALERLRTRVRFIVHANQIGWSRGDARILRLFDRLLFAVPFNGRERSFHPKVILARQQAAGQNDRFVLSVGSRNLTSSGSWDLGVGLVGKLAPTVPAGHRRLSGLREFITALGGLVSDSTITSRFGNLDEVAWELPPDVDQIAFGSHHGEPRDYAATALGKLRGRERVLLISPFLSADMVKRAGEQFAASDSLRLVAGRMDLDRVARSSARGCFGSCGGGVYPYAMIAASDDPPSPLLTAIQEEPDAEAIPDERDLHAKVFAVTDGERARIIVGSANLTTNAWLNRNWEAFLVLRGKAELVNKLWAWADLYAHEYTPIADDTTFRETPNMADDLRNLLATAKFQLDESRSEHATLQCAEMPDFLAQTECVLQVSRYNAMQEWVVWDPSEREIAFASCKLSERAELVVMRAKSDVDECTWLQSVEVTPPLGESRDREAFVAILGVSDFLRYLQGLVSDGADSGGGDEGSQDGAGHSQPYGQPARDTFRLESLLRQLMKDASAFKALDDTVKRYESLLSEMSTPSAESEELKRFLSTWDVIAQGMAIP